MPVYIVTSTFRKGRYDTPAIILFLLMTSLLDQEDHRMEALVTLNESANHTLIALSYSIEINAANLALDLLNQEVRHKVRSLWTFKNWNE